MVREHILDICRVVQIEVQKVSRKDQQVIVIHHGDVKDADGKFIDFYAVPRWFKLEAEGTEEIFKIMPMGQGM